MVKGHSLSSTTRVTRSLAPPESLALLHHQCHSFYRVRQKPLAAYTPPIVSHSLVPAGGVIAALVRPLFSNSMAGVMHMPILRAATRKSTYATSADESMWEPGSYSALVFFQIYVRCAIYFDIVVNGRDDRRRPRLDRDHAKEEELLAEDVINEFSENDILRFMMLPTRWGVIHWDREYLRNQNDQQQHEVWPR